MNITVFGITPYDRGAKVRWLLEEIGLKYESRWLNADYKEYEQPKYLEVNPLGRVPSVLIDDRPMIESGAICAYFADRFADKGFAPALTATDRLDYDQWMFFAASTADSFTSRISIIEDIPPGPVFEKKMSALLTEFREAMEFIDKTLSKKDYLTGQFSAADICMGYHLYFATLWPEMGSIVEEHSQVVQYLDRLKARPGAQRANVFSYKE